MKLFSKVKNYQSHFLKVDSIHKIHYQTAGNPNGMPVFFIHGGPGGQTSPKHFRFFDPNFYHIVLIDQRGCGLSTPRYELRNNTTQNLVQDIEKIRQALKLDKILLFGGSWGTALSLYYAIAYPNNVAGLILRGVFLNRQADIDYLYENGASWFYPQEFETYYNYAQQFEGSTLLQKYYNGLTNPTYKHLLNETAYQFSKWESTLVSLNSKPINPDFETDYQVALFESHYFVNKSFLNDDNYILNNLDAIKNIKTIIVHGRFDLDTRPEGAYILAKHLNNVKLYFTKAGHTQNDLANAHKLVDTTEEFKQYFINQNK
ncbi:prolyl aminopeptidase [Mycoplasma nasistruthionis]|uniref:Proline iminopeptidase n=1 Tax=Mycoplasma nasistruthionis TaxID=353852 RepID=A0A5B7XW51_9MOLU|nr:prolyl aminopeptidase [Mycoplasma nasistruthionis]QCZ36705.1 prolyl aminopeptidase [Mycoplasma nasistruthionis]